MADYNINAVSRKVSYTGASGLGPYAFSFEILVQGDVAVYFNQTLLTITTDYTVTINANGTGSVTLITGGSIPTTPTASDLIVILGAKDIERTTDFVTAGDLRAAALNEQLDALTIFMQQIQEEVDRAVKAPAFDPTGISMTLPKKADRVNAFVAFDANGDISAAVPSDDVTTLAEVATDIKNLADIEDGTIATDAISNTAAIAANVTTVAGIAANVTAVANDQTDIGTVATDLAGSDTIGTVATNIASVNTVATDIADVTTVATNLTGADTIGTVAGIASDVSVVATNVADVTNFADVYIGAAASDPATRADSSALQAGDLYYNTATDDMKVYSGSAWAVVAPTATSVTEAQISDLGTTIVLDSDIGVTVQGYDAENAVTDAAQTFTASQRGTVTTDNDLSFDMNATNFFKCTPTTTAALTFTNITAGQSGNIWLDNSAGVVISAAASTYIASADLTTISTAGVYFLSYYSDGTNVMVSATPAVTSAGA